MFGKNDPFVVFQFDKQETTITTSTRMDAGSECTWDESDKMNMQIVATKNEIIRSHEGLNVKVYDYNMTGNTLIGEARIDIKKLLLSVGKQLEFPRFNLYRSDKDKENGKNFA